MQIISIIGLGWLGRPLGLALKAVGHPIKGSTTSSEKIAGLEEAGFKVYELAFDPLPQGKNWEDLFQTDVLFINIPPQSRSKPRTFHPEQIRQVKALAENAGVKKVIYISSTSVYPDQNQLATESDALSPDLTGNTALLEAEKLLWEDRTYDLTVIRFGGLLGVDRIPGRYFSGKSDVVGDTPVNYIHREDAVALVQWILEKDLWNETYNGVAPLHPMRKEVYQKNAADLGFPPPLTYAEKNSSSWKMISAEKILQTGFAYKFSNPLDFTYEPET